MTEVLTIIETSPLICSANQWTGFYMIGTSVMKELRNEKSNVCKNMLYMVKKAVLSRSSRPEMFCKIGALKNFAKFTGKHLCQILFLIVTSLRLQHFPLYVTMANWRPLPRGHPHWPNFNFQLENKIPYQLLSSIMDALLRNIEQRD